MDTKIAKKALHLLIIPPTGAVLNDHLIVKNIKKLTGTDTVELKERFKERYRAPKEKPEEALVVWVHKDAPRELPPDLHELMEYYSSVRILCTCPACNKVADRDISLTSKFLERPAAHWYCKECI